ncbi:MAG: murein biosynthesis integral membrane protein MurJ [Phycisphaera sp.]|nr:murein biosynthesis integral membrane protein MurJ [Phycisphaera sp.]
MTDRLRLPIRVALVGWWAAMAIGSHWPHLDVAGQFGIANNDVVFGLDKWLHVSCYTGLALLMLMSALYGPGRRGLYLTLVTLFVYSVTDETTQWLIPGRTVGIDDWLASSLGVCLGTGVWAAGHWSHRGDGSFVSRAKLVAMLTMVSRLFGMVRDWSLAWVFGLGSTMDAFVVAFMIPNLFRRLFGEGALSSAFIPQYTRLDDDDPRTAGRFASAVVTMLMLVLMLIVAAAVLVMWAMLAGGAITHKWQLTVELTMLMLWYAPLVCLVAVLGAMLQVHDRFGPLAAAPVILNVAIVGAAFWYHVAQRESMSPTTGLFIVGGAVIVAGLIQIAWQLIALHVARGRWFALRAHDDDAHRCVKETMRVMFLQWAPAVLGLAVLQLNTLADMIIAITFSGDPGQHMHLFGYTPEFPMKVGAAAVLGASARLYEFPLGVFGIAVATAIFPQLSRTADDAPAFANLLRKGMRLTLFIGLPASVGLMLVRNPLAEAIYFRGGSLEAGDAERIAWVLCGYAPAIWAYSMNHILTRAFYAQQNTATPMFVSVAMVSLNVVMNLTLIWPLGAAGLAWSTSICAMLQTVILLVLVRRYVDQPVDRTVARSWAATAAITVVMALVVALTLGAIHIADPTRIQVTGVLFGVTGLGVAVCMSGSLVLRMPEAKWLLSRSADLSTEN